MRRLVLADEGPLELVESPAVSGLLERRLVNGVLVKLVEVDGWSLLFVPMGSKIRRT